MYLGAVEVMDATAIALQRPQALERLPDFERPLIRPKVEQGSIFESRNVGGPNRYGNVLFVEQKVVFPLFELFRIAANDGVNPG